MEAAENWGTYVTVHAYTPRSIRQAIAAGVKCIEHGQLIDEPTVKLMADKGIWWSLQPLLDDEDVPPMDRAQRRRRRWRYLPEPTTPTGWPRSTRSRRPWRRTFCSARASPLAGRVRSSRCCSAGTRPPKH